MNSVNCSFFFAFTIFYVGLLFVDEWVRGGSKKIEMPLQSCPKLSTTLIQELAMILLQTWGVTLSHPFPGKKQMDGRRIKDHTGFSVPYFGGPRMDPESTTYVICRPKPSIFVYTSWEKLYDGLFDSGI